MMSYNLPEPLKGLSLDSIDTSTMGRSATAIKEFLQSKSYCSPGGFFAGLTRLELAMILCYFMDLKNNESKLKPYLDLLLICEGVYDVEPENYEEYFQNFYLLCHICGYASTNSLPVNFLNISVTQTDLAIVGQITIDIVKKIPVNSIERVLIDQFRM